MTRFEPLESRRLLAGRGLDASYDNDGELQNSARLYDGNAARAVVVTDAGTFVSGPESHDVAKFEPDGRVDTSWGEQGVVHLAIRPTQLAYDERTGALYASGADDASTGSSYAVQRVDAEGAIDDAYGDDGVARPYGVKANASATVQKLVTLDDGELLVALERRTTTSRDDSQIVYFQDVGLMRLTDDGSRDRTFSDKPVLPLQGGAYHYSLVDGDYQPPDVGVVVNFRDLAVETDGAYRAVYTRTDGSSRLGQTDPLPTLTGRLDVKLRTITPAGENLDAGAHAWTLREATPSLIFLAEYDGHDRVHVVRRGGGNEVTPRLGAGTLSPGRAPRFQIFDAAVPIFADAVVRNADGNYFVRRGRTVTRVLDSLRVDTRFAYRGTGTIAGDAIVGLAADDHNRAIVAVNTQNYIQSLGRLERFA